MARAVEREPLREALRRVLSDRIVAGELRSGEPIRLVATASEMGVSVTPLRESLVQLEIDGFVESQPGRGYTVSDMQASEVEEVYPLIWTLESQALRAAAPTAALRSALRDLNDRFRRSDDPTEAQRLDREWHRTLLLDCGNRTLLGFLDVLKRRAARYEVAFMRQMQRAGSSRSADQHEEIVCRLEEGDTEGAVGVLADNWRAGPRVLLPWLEGRTEPEPAARHG